MNRTILIVDDDLDSRSICTVFLRHFGYTVLEATDGAEGVRLAREILPDLIVMDLTLPVLDGWAATAQLKAHGPTAGIPVVMLTARAMESDRAQGRSAGCASYLTKPCSPTLLKNEIQRLLQEPYEA